jgi:hypothetical protein
MHPSLILILFRACLGSIICLGVCLRLCGRICALFCQAPFFRHLFVCLLQALLEPGQVW